jgi:hypothetical protein
MRFWCKRKDFRTSLDYLLEGEDPEFVAYMKKVSTQATAS